MVASVGILVGSVFLGIKLANSAGEEPGPPPAALPVSPVNTTITSLVQMALLFIESQKSGKLPEGYPITWRNDSGLLDGQDQNRDLQGGFYDGGSNIKYHFPMAYTVTMLSWALLEYEGVYQMWGMDNEMADLIQWGVDYLLKAKYEDLYFTQIGTPEIDDQCWIRPEDQKPQQRPTLYPCDINHPCSDLAGEFAAAFAASSLVYRIGNPAFADVLLQNAIESFKFADTYRGKYSDYPEGRPNVHGEYNSTDYGDELMWAATWLYFASADEYYLEYLTGENAYLFGTNEWNDLTKFFSWDQKSAGVQVLMTRLLVLGFGVASKNTTAQFLQTYMNSAKLFVCQYTPTWTNANFTDAGPQNGLIWQGPSDHPLQYPINAGFLGTLLSDYLRVTITANESSHFLDCDATVDDVVRFFADQTEYILGKNPLQMSYMVGYQGPKGDRTYPTNVHHKASSIPNRKRGDPAPDCSNGRSYLLNSDPNPNVLVGALVGGPAQDDSYDDDRQNKEQSEPKTHINAVFAGLLAGLAAPIRPGNNLTRMWVQLPKFFKYANLLEVHITKAPPPPPAPAVPPPPWTQPPAGSDVAAGDLVASPPPWEAPFPPNPAPTRAVTRTKGQAVPAPPFLGKTPA